jgi:hypothetical protein
MPQPKTDRFIGCLGLIGMVVVFALQANGVEMNWQTSTLVYAVSAISLVWSLLRHAIPHIGTVGKWISAVLALAVVAALGSIGTLKEYRREHAPISQVLPSPQPVIVNGNCSSGNTGDGNTISVNCGDQSRKQK